MAVLQTYQTTINREDLSDYMRLVDPESNWALKNFDQKEKAKARYIEWPLDEIATPTANTTKVEGFTVSYGTLTQPTRAGNYCEISSENGQVSRTQESVDTAGQRSTLAYQIQKAMKLLKKKMEYSIVINSSATSGASGTARKTKGLLGWITTHTSSATATGIDLSQTLFNDNLQAIWDTCGDPESEIHTLCGSYNKRMFSEFTGVSASAITIPAVDKKRVSSVTVIDTDFGFVNIHKHHVLNANSAGTVINLFDAKAFDIAWLDPVFKKNMPETGDFHAFMLVGEYALRSYQQKKAGKIINTATS